MRHVSLLLPPVQPERLAHYTGALWRSIGLAIAGPFYHILPIPTRTVGAWHTRSMGRAPPGRGWSLGSKEQRPEINAKLEPDAKRQKKTHMLHSTVVATAFLVVRIRPTKLSFPNNRMKNAQRQATDNNATWCAFLAYLLTYAH